MDSRLVLIFHGIGGRPPWAGADEEAYWCSERNFLSILDAIPQLSAELQIPIELTFDDGNATDVSIAAPALQKRGLKATFFVCAGRIGKQGYLDKAQLRSLSAAGMSIGSHGWDHVDWRTLGDESALNREIVEARDVIADTVCGRPIESVAIPFGSYDRRVRQAVAKAFTEVHTSDGGLATVSCRTVPRECYTIAWETDTLRRLAAPRPFFSALRRSLAVAYKQRRGRLPEVRTSGAH
jgi:peptidoglycan/xylan/chitin deacetylase (PgdA/CDA1 family)